LSGDTKRQARTNITTQRTVQVEEQRFNNQQRSNQVIIAWQTNPVGAVKGKVRNLKRQVKTQTGKIRIEMTERWIARETHETIWQRIEGNGPVYKLMGDS